jgi:hypothetical protein
MGHPLIWTGEAGEDGEAGDGDQRKVEGVAEALGGAEADALSGEGAGAVDDGDGVEFCKAEAEASRQRPDGWDEALGGGSAREACGGWRGSGAGENDAAGCATGVDEQNLQFSAASCGG